MIKPPYKRSATSKASPSGDPTLHDEIPSSDESTQRSQQKSPFVRSRLTLLQMANLVQVDPDALPWAESIRAKLKHFPFGPSDFAQRQVIDGIVVDLHLMMQAQMAVMADLEPRLSPKARRAQFELLGKHLASCLDVLGGLSKQDYWSLWRAFGATCREHAKFERGNDVAKLIHKLVEEQIGGLDWGLVTAQEFLRTWTHAVHAVASDLDVERGRPRTPQDVKAAVEALGCLWTASSGERPKIGDKKGSFGDFALTLTPMLIKDASPSQIKTAVRQLVQLSRNQPGYLMVDPLADT